MKIKYINKMNSDKERGFISLAFAGILAIVMAVVIAQIILNQKNLNSVHSSTRSKIIMQQKLKALALEFEEASKQAEVSLGCPTGTSRRTINGGDFCLPAGDGYCTTLTRVVNGTDLSEQICTSLRASDLAWNDAFSGNENLIVTSGSSTTTGVRNRIRVPDMLTDPLWQTCLGETCLRVLLCATGSTECTTANAVAYQVVKF